MNKIDAGMVLIGVFAVLFIASFMLYSVMDAKSINTKIEESYEIMKKVEADNKQIQDLIDTINNLERINRLQHEQILEFNNFLKEHDISFAEITGYAPLDPRAVEGMCYWGDPSVTASGAKVDTTRTIAAARDIPFGTEIYVPGYGWRVVEDRGGMITSGKLDIAVDTLEEAYKIGRQTVPIIIKKEVI